MGFFKSIGNFFERAGGAIASKNSFAGKITRSTFSAVTAPVSFGADILGGKNIATSFQSQSLKTFGLSNPALQLAPVRNTLGGLSSSTFGITGNVVKASDTAYKLGQYEQNVSSSEISGAYKAQTMAQAKVIGGGAALSAAGVGLTATNAATGAGISKALTSGNFLSAGSQLAGIGGFDFGLGDTGLADTFDIGKDFLKGMSGSLPNTPIVTDPYGASSGAGTVRPDGDKKSSAVLYIAAIAIAIYFYKRRK